MTIAASTQGVSMYSLVISAAETALESLRQHYSLLSVLINVLKHVSSAHQLA